MCNGLFDRPSVKVSKEHRVVPHVSSRSSRRLASFGLLASRPSGRQDCIRASGPPMCLLDGQIRPGQAQPIASIPDFLSAGWLSIWRGTPLGYDTRSKLVSTLNPCLDIDWKWPREGQHCICMMSFLSMKRARC